MYLTEAPWMLGKMLVFHLWKNVPPCHTQPAKATQRIASLTYLSPLILLKLQVSSASLPRSTRERTRACQRKTMEVKSKKLLKKSLTEWGKKVWKCRKPPCFFGKGESKQLLITEIGSFVALFLKMYNLEKALPIAHLHSTVTKGYCSR